MMHLPEPSKNNGEREGADSKKTAESDRAIVSLADRAIIQIHPGEAAQNSANCGKAERSNAGYD